MLLDDETLRARLADPTGEWSTRDELRDAAVLLLLLDREGADHLVFQLRRDDLPSHPGQVSFPGGARDPDEDAVECALRETHEEIGVPGDAITVLGRLPERVSIAGYLVTPFAGRLDRPRPYHPEVREVVDVFEVPMAAFLEDHRWSFRPTNHPRRTAMKIPYFDYEGRIVWGLTAIILRDFLRLVTGNDPRADLG